MNLTQTQLIEAHLAFFEELFELAEKHDLRMVHSNLSLPSGVEGKRVYYTVHLNDGLSSQNTFKAEGSTGVSDTTPWFFTLEAGKVVPKERGTDA